MSEKENDTKKMLETLRKLPEKAQEKDRLYDRGCGAGERGPRGRAEKGRRRGVKETVRYVGPDGEALHPGDRIGLEPPGA